MSELVVFCGRSAPGIATMLFPIDVGSRKMLSHRKSVHDALGSRLSRDFARLGTMPLVKTQVSRVFRHPESPPCYLPSFSCTEPLFHIDNALVLYICGDTNAMLHGVQPWFAKMLVSVDIANLDTRHGPIKISDPGFGRETSFRKNFDERRWK